MSPIPATNLKFDPVRSAQSCCQWIEQSVRYKPNTQIKAWVKDEDKYRSYHSYSDTTIVVSMQIFGIPDSTKSDGSSTSIVFTQTWSFLHIKHGGMNLLLEYLRKFLRDWEMHEMDEWFRIDGTHVRDPHANDPMRGGTK